MESVLGRYRNLTILVGVLFLQVLGLAVQVKRGNDADSTRLIRIWAVGAITPFERGLVWAQNGSGNLWHNYFFLRGVRAENRQLKEQIEQMRLKEVRLSEDATQAHRLQSLLAFKEQFIVKTVPAQVIGSSGSDLSRSIYIDRGSNDGLTPDMAVITAGGIVGKVLRVYPSTSLVLMINDQSSGVGGMLEKSRLQGVLRGTANGEVILERVMSDEQVAPGDTVLSSGGDQIFPKGLPVGTVSKVSPGKDMFLNILVRPAADLSRLEEVLVVTEKQEKNAVVDSGGRVRAADILAERLPSVPDKPAVVTPAPGTTPSGAIASSAAGTSVGVKTAIPAGSSTKPEVAGHGLAEHNLVKPVGTGSGTPVASAPTGGNTASLTEAHSVPVAAQQPATGQVLKKVVQKAPVGASATGGSGSNGGTGNATGLSPAKPAAPRPKPPTAEPSPQPPPTEDNPH
ncbi:MAG: rod shape-determining protein MreC [Candidatus Sulfotelmatobacter sp.]|jgi:rod shape-determining protein MreC